MSTLEQLQDNVSFMREFRPLDERGHRAVEKVREIYLAQNMIPCTGCRYCVDGCPMQIRIPDLFNAFNMKKAFRNWGQDAKYKEIVEGGSGKASDCVRCGQCESVCPQHLSIRDLLEGVAVEFEKE